MSIYYNNIKIAFRKAKEELAYYDLQELLSENQSYLCSEYRPEISLEIYKVLNKLSTTDQQVILDALDDYWITLLHTLDKKVN